MRPARGRAPALEHREGQRGQGGHAEARFDLGDGAYAPLDAINESRAYLRDLVAHQRRKPGDGLIRSLIAAHGDELSDQELAGLADGVLTGGLETSASMLASLSNRPYQPCGSCGGSPM